MGDNIKKTEEFLKRKFEESEYFKTREEEKVYRIEHSYRVANIGKAIAEREGFNVEAMIIGCLLHDVSYCMTFITHEDHVGHGRTSARIARGFLKTLDLDEKTIGEICYGIAIHVDGKADFEGEENGFTNSISDADNIDRFDVYRIYDILRRDNLYIMTLDEKKAYVEKKISRLNELKDFEISTKTGKELWLEKINYQIGYYERLREQMKNSSEISK